MQHLMPQMICANDPDQALESGLWWLKIAGEVNDSRNGRVLVAPAPVITTYTDPTKRVIFNPLRDANPFFHLFESLWMLAGRNDVASVANYAKQMESFSDDGLQWGAYGYRWRHFFGFDQLLEVIDQLRADPKTRRAVMTMWSPAGDMVPVEVQTLLTNRGGKTAKDVPCNTHIYFDLTRGKLNMTVSNRSNDIVWGAYGANLVHMSVLQEFVAAAVRAPLGVYHQWSNNYHAYIDRPDVQRLLDTSQPNRDHWAVKLGENVSAYNHFDIRHFPLMRHADSHIRWLDQCEAFVANPVAGGLSLPFFTEVAGPMMRAHAAYKSGDYVEAVYQAGCVAAVDWRMAAQTWLATRAANRAAKEQA